MGISWGVTTSDNKPMEPRPLVDVAMFEYIFALMMLALFILIFNKASLNDYYFLTGDMIRKHPETAHCG